MNTCKNCLYWRNHANTHIGTCDIIDTDEPKSITAENAGSPALAFHHRWNKYYLKDLNPHLHSCILQDIEILKEKYNSLYTQTDRGFSFGTLRDFSKWPIKKERRHEVIEY